MLRRKISGAGALERGSGPEMKTSNINGLWPVYFVIAGFRAFHYWRRARRYRRMVPAAVPPYRDTIEARARQSAGLPVEVFEASCAAMRQAGGSRPDLPQNAAHLGREP